MAGASLAQLSLAETIRDHRARIVAALAAHFRDLDLAEDGLAEACARAAEVWPRDGAPVDGAAWLYRVAERHSLQALRHRRTTERLVPEPPEPERNAEEILADDATIIPDERLRLIFVCCHPAVAAETRAALTLKMVCGLSSQDIARAFLLSEPTLAQRLVRAKRKIAEAGVPFEVPGPDAWPERMEAVLATLEIAYARAHEDAAGAGPHAGYAREMLGITALLARLAPEDADVAALAALVRFAEARRPARLDDGGAMVPLSEQDPQAWRAPMIAEAEAYLERTRSAPLTARILQAALHGAWCTRRSLAEPAPWPLVKNLYDRLLAMRDDPIVRLNRAVALAETEGPALALAEVEGLDASLMANFPPYHAVRADLLRRLSRPQNAMAAYDAALALEPPPAERLWLERRRASF